MVTRFMEWAILYLIPAVLLAIGTASYRGRWRKWAAREPRHFEFGKRSYMGFFVFYTGVLTAAAVTLAWAGSADAPPLIMRTLEVLCGLSLVLVGSTLTRFPRFLQPAWYRRWIDEGEVKMDLLGRDGSSHDRMLIDWIQNRAGRK